MNDTIIVVLLSFRRPKKVVPLHLQKLRTMYDTIKDYHDAKGRQLSQIFMKLPNKNEYPDYYEVIKQPMNMEKIASTLKNAGYETLDDLVSDFILMFDNACKYNEPDSQIYKVCTPINENSDSNHSLIPIFSLAGRLNPPEISATDQSTTQRRRRKRS